MRLSMKRDQRPVLQNPSNPRPTGLWSWIGFRVFPRWKSIAAALVGMGIIGGGSVGAATYWDELSSASVTSAMEIAGIAQCEPDKISEELAAKLNEALR